VQSRTQQGLKLAALGVAAIVVAVLVVMSLQTKAPPPSDPGLAARVAAADAKFEAERVAKEAAIAESKIVRITMPQGRPLRVFYAADSLGAGFFSTEKDGGYRYRINAELAQYGETRETVATKPADAPLFKIGTINAVPRKGIDLAVIELGTNDINSTELPEFKATYDKVLTDIQAGSPQVKIVCAGTWGFSGSNGSDPYDSVIEQTCKAHQGVYIDMTDLFEETDENDKEVRPNVGPANRATWAGPSDDFHPNDVGHGKIASAIIERLRITRSA
jgi:acyl-CoA thioesterase-1